MCKFIPVFADEENERRVVGDMLRAGQMMDALGRNAEYTLDYVRNFYQRMNAEDQSRLNLDLEQCDPIDATIYLFHQRIILNYEATNEQGVPTHKPDYLFFLSNYQTLLDLKKQCQLYISPQLWNDESTQYIYQAYYIVHELRRRRYDVGYIRSFYEIFKMGYETSLYSPQGDYAIELLKLMTLILDEVDTAMEIRHRAEIYGVLFSDMPGDRPLLLDSYRSNLMTGRRADPVLWLNDDMTNSTSQPDKRIHWLQMIQDKEADALVDDFVPQSDIVLIKYGCELLRYFYRRLKDIVLHMDIIPCYRYNTTPEDRVQTERYIYLSHIEAKEMFAFAQALNDGSQRQREVPATQSLMEIPAFLDKLVSPSLYTCFRYLCYATAYRQSYLENLPKPDLSDLNMNEFLSDYFRIYTDLRKKKTCIARIYEESEKCIAECKNDPQTEPLALELSELYLNYLQETYPDEVSPKSVHTDAAPPPALMQRWQQILTDYALTDEKCKESYGSHNVRIAMYIKALEEVRLLNIAERQADKAETFYRTLSDIFGYRVVQRSVEWQLNHFQENDKNKYTYDTEILSLIKNIISSSPSHR